MTPTPNRQPFLESVRRRCVAELPWRRLLEDTLAGEQRHACLERTRARCRDELRRKRLLYEVPPAADPGLVLARVHERSRARLRRRAAARRIVRLSLAAAAAVLLCLGLRVWLAPSATRPTVTAPRPDVAAMAPGRAPVPAWVVRTRAYPELRVALPGVRVATVRTTATVQPGATVTARVERVRTTGVGMERLPVNDDELLAAAPAGSIALVGWPGYRRVLAFPAHRARRGD